MRARLWLIAVPILLLGAVLPAAASSFMTEVWRGGAAVFSYPSGVSVNAADGSCWMVQQGPQGSGSFQVIHLAQDGTELWRSAGTPAPALAAMPSVSVSAKDGSCWVADVGNSEMIHLAQDGTELWRSAAAAFSHPGSPSANSADGSCWVVDGDHSQVVHLAADGTEMWRGTFPPNAESVSANSRDGSCWVTYGGYYADVSKSGVVHLAADGTELWRGSSFSSSPYLLSVNPTDGSCWTTESGLGLVVHLAEDGTKLWESPSAIWAVALAVNPVDGSCWAGQNGQDANGVTHLAQDGTVLWQSTGPWTFWPLSVSVNPTDGSCWVADVGYNRIVHLDRMGAKLWQSAGTGKFLPASATTNSADGSCWTIAEYPDSGTSSSWLMRFAADGEVLLDLSNHYQFDGPGPVSATDTSCWVGCYGLRDLKAFMPPGIITGGPTVARFDSSGNLLWTKTFSTPVRALAVDPNDDSSWVLNDDSVSHLDSGGNEVFFAGLPVSFHSISLNPADGSFWVANWLSPGQGVDQVVHYDHNGSQVWGSPGAPTFSMPSSVSVYPTDGSCWVADTGNNQIVHLTASGTESWRSAATFSSPGSVAADSTDGSCWVADTGNNRVVLLAGDGTELWTSTVMWTQPLTPTFSAPTSVSADLSDGSCWVIDGGNGQLVHLVPVPTSPAAAFSASPSNGLAPLTAAFTDQSTGSPAVWYWSFGDGTSSVAQNPLHQYQKDGSYTVSLTVTNARGSNTTTQAAAVFVGFVDVPAGFWASDQVLACVDAGIVTGYSDGTYKPTDPVTRDQMAVFISRALAGGDASVPAGPSTATFSDVATDYWAFRYVEYAVSKAVVKGYSDGTYKPTDEVTRDQMSVFIARAIATPSDGADLVNYVPPTTATFPDVATTFWAYKYVEYIAQPGIGVTKGYPDGDYHPEYICTRDQMAVYVARAFRLQ